jgi:hypothetical protein
MMKNSTLSEMMMETDFGDGIDPTIPTNFQRGNFSTIGIVDKNY